ncbi:DUF4401 domain-containing protein [Lutibacter sp. HS1-25]|uniref:DUF4401 domain-containing protein n=1 Tax=Lutibacter sp. HS1-25 TaxID=2485000 RepID=UPI0010127658|nr:DUF4401 domain-containing protein [Lutibacter sp. HS1-25]RXP53798.1 DUF4401 domain-containing protein [Lutibacter sp. HS1-25]
MDKNEQILATLKSVQDFEGKEFQCNEQAILLEYQKREQNKTSLAIKILSLFGGFFATQSFLGFLSLMGLFDSPTALVAVGIAFVIAAISINKKFDKIIFDTISISAYVTGLVLLGIGLHFFNATNSVIALAIFVVAFITLVLNQTYILSFVAVITACGSILSLIILNKVYELFQMYTVLIAAMLTYVILNEGKIITINNKFSKLYNPIRIGLIFSLLFGLAFLGNRTILDLNIGFIWLSSVMLMLLVIYLVSQIVKILEVTDKKNQITIYLLTVLVLSSTIFAPSILGAILIVLLCFLVNYKTGLVIGIIALIYFISQYYYDLNFSLLTKSIILIVSGILFLVFYAFIHKKSVQNEKI